MVRMNRVVGIALFVVVSLLGRVGMSLAIESGNVSLRHLEGGYSVEIPLDSSLTQRSVADFVVYKVMDSAGKQLVLIYLGNFPDTSSKPPSNSVTSSTRIGGYKATLDRWTGKGGTVNGKTLIQLTDGHWPKFAHILFKDLPRRDSEVAERVVRSFKSDPTPKQGEGAGIR
jgi:hypothetical protein